MPWSDEKMFQHFVAQVRAAFAKENEAYRKQETEALARIVANGKTELEPWMAVRDSFLMDTFNACELSYARNMVAVKLPDGFGHTTDIVEMFDGTSVAWSKPFITAADNRVVIEVMLIDTWDDVREAEWQREAATMNN